VDIFLAPVLTVARFVEHKLLEGSNGGPRGALTTARDQLPFLENGHRRRSRDLPRAHYSSLSVVHATLFNASVLPSTAYNIFRWENVHFLCRLQFFFGGGCAMFQIFTRFSKFQLKSSIIHHIDLHIS
jgi:hypothetical protein